MTKVLETSLPGVKVIEPSIYPDKRGFFKETFQVNRYSEYGIDCAFVQDNFSKSTKGVLRGLHFQKIRPQGKLVSCTAGTIFDVAVDIDKKSATFGQYFSIELSGENHRQLWVPPGYAHGFCVMTAFAHVSYKCTDYYNADDQHGLLWNDPDLAIPWPVNRPVVSEKDEQLPTLHVLTEYLDPKIS